MIYLDYVAATPLDPDVKKAMEAAEKYYANPSANYAMARESRGILESARQKIAQNIGAKKEEIIFTSGGTESDNLAIFGIARANQEFGKHIISAFIEHSSIQQPLKVLSQEGFAVDYCEVNQNGTVNLENLQKLITPKTILITFALANSELGTIQPISKITKLIQTEKEKRKRATNNTPLYFHCDGSAAFEQFDVKVDRLGVDCLSINGAKIYGPKRSGALYVKRGTKLSAQIVGGGQEEGLRAGSADVVGAVGLAEALDKTAKIKQAEKTRVNELRYQLFKELVRNKIKYELNSPLKSSLASIINITLDGYYAEKVVDFLDAVGIAVATGAACQAGSAEPSQVLLAIGKTEDEANSTIRISLGRHTTKAEIKKFCTELKKVLTKLDTIYS